LEFHTFMKLKGRGFQHFIQLCEETGNPLFFIFNVHAFDCQTYDVDRRERQVAASDRCFRSETVFEYAGTASHSRHFVFVTFGIVGSPVFMLVECGIQVQEVREEAAGSHFAGQFIQVIVPVFRQITYAPFLFPYLDRENGGFTVADTPVCAFQQFTDYAAAFGGRIRSVVDRAEYHLVSTA